MKRKTPIVALIVALLLLTTALFTLRTYAESAATPSSTVSPAQDAAGKDRSPMKCLNLTEEQKTKMKALREDSKTKLAALREEQQAKMKAILTPEQIAKLDAAKAEGNEKQGKGKRGGIFKELNLTDEQKTKMKAIREELQPKLAALREQQESAMKQVLTPEQQKTLEEMKSKRKDCNCRGKGKRGGRKQ